MFFDKQPPTRLPKPNDHGSYLFRTAEGMVGIFPIRGTRLVALYGEGKYMLSLPEGVVYENGLNDTGNVRAFDTPEMALGYYAAWLVRGGAAKKKGG